MTSFGRLHALIHPDGEALRDAYAAGGLIRAAVGVKDSPRFDYRRYLWRGATASRHAER